MAIVKCACVVMVMLVLVAVRELGGVHARVGKDETPAPSQEPVIWPEQLVDGELKTGAIVHLAADEPEFRAALTRSGVSWDRMMKTMLGGTYRVNTVSQQQDGTQFATLTSPDDVAGQADWRVPAEVLTIAAGDNKGVISEAQKQNLVWLTELSAMAAVIQESRAASNNAKRSAEDHQRVDAAAALAKQDSDAQRHRQQDAAAAAEKAAEAARATAASDAAEEAKEKARADTLSKYVPNYDGYKEVVAKPPKANGPGGLPEDKMKELYQTQQRLVHSERAKLTIKQHALKQDFKKASSEAEANRIKALLSTFDSQLAGLKESEEEVVKTQRKDDKISKIRRNQKVWHKIRGLPSEQTAFSKMTPHEREDYVENFKLEEENSGHYEL